eukprot:scaffold2843_cov90-Isochrysis_galbana.AAC.6
MAKYAKPVLCEQKWHVQPQVLPFSIFGTHTPRVQGPAQDPRILRNILVHPSFPATSTSGAWEMGARPHLPRAAEARLPLAKLECARDRGGLLTIDHDAHFRPRRCGPRPRGQHLASIQHAPPPPPLLPTDRVARPCWRQKLSCSLPRLGPRRIVDPEPATNASSMSTGSADGNGVQVDRRGEAASRDEGAEFGLTGTRSAAASGRLAARRAASALSSASASSRAMLLTIRKLSREMRITRVSAIGRAVKSAT